MPLTVTERETEQLSPVSVRYEYRQYTLGGLFVSRKRKVAAKLLSWGQSIFNNLLEATFQTKENLELYYGSDSKCAAICAILSWARLFFLTSIIDRSLSTYEGLPAFRLVVHSRRKLKDRHVWT